MSEHTPGPWTAKKHQVWREHKYLAFAALVRPDPEDRLDGESWLDMRNRTQPERDAIKAETQANARIIAAAPDLLEALEGLVGITDELVPGFVWGSGSYKNMEQHRAAAIETARAAIAKAKGEQDG